MSACGKPSTLITSFTYPPNKDGVAMAASTMAEGLAQRGWKVTVATQSHPQRRDDDRRKVDVISFDLATSTYRSQQSKVDADRYTRFLRSLDPDFIINHCWDSWSTQLALPVFHQLKGRKVQVSHGFSQHIWHYYPKFPFFGLGQWVKGVLWTARLLPRMIKAYDAIVILSEATGFGRFFDHTVARWMKHPRIRIIPNGTDPAQFSTDGSRFRSQHSIGDRLMVLCVANYSERKNQELAVRAFRRARIEDAVLVLIGSEFNIYSRHVERVSEKTEHCGGQVIFLEGISREETLDAYMGSDIFLLTAKAETQPIVLIESMAAGVPWISTPTGCVRFMEGGIVAKGEKMLTSAISKLVGDADLRRRLGLEGRSAARESYCARKTLDSFENLLLSLRA